MARVKKKKAKRRVQRRSPERSSGASEELAPGQGAEASPEPEAPEASSASEPKESSPDSGPPDPGELLTPEPTGRARLAVQVAIVLALVLQVAIPAAYYLGNDPYDERFSWRMFSNVRMRSCNLTVREGSGESLRPVQPRTMIHVAWINTMRRGREAVIERYLRYRCDHAEIETARADLSCRDPSGEPVPPESWQIACASGEIERQRGAQPGAQEGAQP